MPRIDNAQRSVPATTNPGTSEISAEDAGVNNANFYTPKKIETYKKKFLANEIKLIVEGHFRDFDPTRDIYRNHTGVKATDVDEHLNLSRFTNKEGRTIALVGAYPLRERLGDFFRVIYNERPSIVVNLTAADADRPAYFIGANDFELRQTGEEEAASIHVKNFPISAGQFGDLQAEHRDMRITNPRVSSKSISIPMLHISNWADKTTPSVESLKALALHLNQIKKETGRPPLIHCEAGIFRSGILTALMRIYDPDDHASVETIVREMQEQRDSRMTVEETSALIAGAKEMGKALLDSDVAASIQGTQERQAQGARLFASETQRKISASSKFDSSKPSSSKTNTVPTLQLKNPKPSTSAQQSQQTSQASQSQQAAFSTGKILRPVVEKSLVQVQEDIEGLRAIAKTSRGLSEVLKQLLQKNSKGKFTVGIEPLTLLLRGPASYTSPKEKDLHHLVTSLAVRAFLNVLIDCIDQAQSPEEIDAVLSVLTSPGKKSFLSFKKIEGFYRKIFSKDYAEVLRTLEHLLSFSAEKLAKMNLPMNHPRLIKIVNFFIEQGFRDRSWEPQLTQQGAAIEAEKFLLAITVALRDSDLAKELNIERQAHEEYIATMQQPSTSKADEHSAAQEKSSFSSLKKSLIEIYEAQHIQEVSAQAAAIERRRFNETESRLRADIPGKRRKPQQTPQEAAITLDISRRTGPNDSPVFQQVSTDNNETNDVNNRSDEHDDRSTASDTSTLPDVEPRRTQSLPPQKSVQQTLRETWAQRVETNKDQLSGVTGTTEPYPKSHQKSVSDHTVHKGVHKLTVVVHNDSDKQREEKPDRDKEVLVISSTSTEESKSKKKTASRKN